MAYLTAAVVLVGGLCVLNLLLTLGVIRRLREHTELLSRRGSVADDRTPQPGQVIGEFSSGGLVTADLGERTLVGFFSPSCAPCKEMLPSFVELAKGYAGPVVAVVVAAGDEDAPGSVAALEPVARVVVEAPGGAAGKAFGVSAWPTFLVVSGGRVEVAGHDVDSVAARA
ncbi:TlpA family protein disulfide reductase [Longispora albida]|uniref:TlpA family protein disulfide reductase n=1 Tax=Longispora albida TaxID=203523 RepID=UPI0004754332|nr:thioredoxin domain-containing protein [Longispora albida]